MWTCASPSPCGGEQPALSLVHPGGGGREHRLLSSEATRGGGTPGTPVTRQAGRPRSARDWGAPPTEEPPPDLSGILPRRTMPPTPRPGSPSVEKEGQLRPRVFGARSPCRSPGARSPPTRGPRRLQSGDRRPQCLRAPPPASPPPSRHGGRSHLPGPLRTTPPGTDVTGGHPQA